MDSGLNEQVGNIARNLIPRLRILFGKPAELGDKTYLRLCRLLTVLLGMGIICMSILFSANKDLILFDAYLLIGSLFGVSLLLPTLSGLIFSKLPRWSYWVVFGASMTPSLYSLWDTHFYGTNWTIQDRSLWVLLFGVAATLACQVLHRKRSPKEKEEVSKFFELMRKPVDFAAEIGESRDASQLLMIGNSIVAIGALMLLILLVPNGFWPRICIIFVSGTIVGLGLLMRYGAKRERKKAETMSASTSPQ